MGCVWLVEKRFSRHAGSVRAQPVPEAVPRADGAGDLGGREEIARGLKFLISPGQALPVSGILAAGEADFSLEWIHGEADPVRFTAGSRLPAGAILLSRISAAVEAGEKWQDSLLAKLTAPSTGDRTSPGLDRLLRVYLTIVLLLGCVALAISGLRGDWLTGVQAMISVFVVSCPCALGANDSLADDASLVTGTPVVDRSLRESKADFYTLGSGLGFLRGLLDAAMARKQAVRTAFAFALCYNLTAVMFFMAGKMSPLLTAILMPLSSIFSIVIVAGISSRKR